METKLDFKNCRHNNDDSNCLNYCSMVHSKKVVKHALRQQVKRRRKNTTIAAGSARSIPRVIHATPSTLSADLSFSGINQQNHIVCDEAAVTMKEVLASLPGFSIKSNRRRSTKKLSVAAQLEAGLVDLESPASILANTSLRALLNRHTFQGLPPLYQRKLAQLLPSVDRQDAATSGLNNEFFARACQEWRKRLAEGEFTPENQQRLKMEAEKDKNKLDPWKLKHFEPIWGEKREAQKFRSGTHCFSKDQRFTKTITKSYLGAHMKTNLNPIFKDLHSSNASLAQEKSDQEATALVNNESGEAHLSIKSHTIVPEFDVTIRISEDDEEDDDNEEDEDDDEDEEDDEDDDDEDEDDDDEDEDEDEDDEDEIDTRVPLSYLNEETQHCRTIIVANTNDEQLFTHKNLSSKISSVDRSNNSKGMLFDFISDGKYIDVGVKMRERKVDPPERNDEKSFQSTFKEFKCISNTVESGTQKFSECPIRGSLEECVKISDNHFLESKSIRGNSVTDGKYILTDGSCRNDARSDKSVTEKEKSFGTSILYCPENDRNNCEDTDNVITEISEVIEIDNDTLQRFHELEVRGEMQETYEEISRCPEEMMYPILEDIGLNSRSSKISETLAVAGSIGNQITPCNISNGIQDEAFQEANNYVCNEMLDCSWTSSTNQNTVLSDKEDLQVPWPLVAAALDDTSTNVTITTVNDCNESQSHTNQNVSRCQDQLHSDIEDSSESANCIQLPVTPFNSETMRFTAPVTSCLMKNMHSTQNSSIITFPQLQSIRFVQTNFQTTIEHTSSETMPNTTLCAQIQSSTDISQQSRNSLSTSIQSSVLCRNRKDVIHHKLSSENEFESCKDNTFTESCSQQQNVQTQSTVVLQQQTLIPLSSRQIITMQSQPQSQYPMLMNIHPKTNRPAGTQSTHRASRNGNREQNNIKTRNVNKEPPGAVNLERSYQICQAVIANSPNRDQLKAHLKPPPSLLTKHEKLFANNKFGAHATTNSIKTQRNPSHVNISGSILQNKASSFKPVYATNSQNCSGEASQDNVSNQISFNNSGVGGQYMLVKKTGTKECAPRASSAPPMPPQLGGVSIGVHIIRGRPASAGENSLQAVTLRTKGNHFRDFGGAEIFAPNVNVGGDPPSPCECNIQGAMIICRQCGAYCHDDCIGPQCICDVCLIR